MQENRNRSIVKSISWRVIATASTTVTAFLFTGEFAVSIGVGLLSALFNTLLYYAHERAWNKIFWGHVERGVTLTRAQRGGKAYDIKK